MTPDTSTLLSSPFGQPMAQIYYDALGKSGALGLMTLLFLVQFLMGLSILVAVSRQSWAFSRDGALPFSNFFRRVSPRLLIPVRAVWGCVLVACVLGLLCLIAPAAAAALFSLAVAANNVAWGTPILCRLVWGQKKFKPGPVYTGDKFSTPIGWLAIAFLAFGIVLAMFPAGGPDPTPQTMNYTVVVNCAVWGGSLLYYFIGKCEVIDGNLGANVRIQMRESGSLDRRLRSVKTSLLKSSKLLFEKKDCKSREFRVLLKV